MTEAESEMQPTDPGDDPGVDPAPHDEASEPDEVARPDSDPNLDPQTHIS